MIHCELPGPPAPIGNIAALAQIIADEFDGEIVGGAAARRERGASYETSDPVARHLEAQGLVEGENGQGHLIIECPWADEHTDGTGRDAAWLPAGVNGYEQGHFKCFHGSCLARTDDEFLEMVGLGVAEDFETLPMRVEGLSSTDTPVADAPGFKRDKQGRIEAILPNLIDALRAPGWTGTDFAIDSFREEIVVSPHGRGLWRPLRDHDPISLRDWLERRGFKSIGKESMRDALLRVAEDHRFDSAVLWLGGLEWDGAPRIETFLTDHFGVADTPYARAVARYWWTGHAARVLDPGHRCDMVPILVSPEGRYKSSTLQALVPDMESFIEIDLDHRDDDLSRKMRGALLGELAELRGLRGRSGEANKAWVTRRFEEWTPKYQENKVRLARRLMFVGTTNEAAFLDETTGRRRWLPVTVQGAGDPRKLAAARDQLWAEGAAAYRVHGEVEWQGAYDLGAAEHGQYVIEDVWQEAVERWLSEDDDSATDATQLPATRLFTTERAFICALGRSADRVTKSDRDRMAMVLRAINYELRVRRVEGRNVKVWVSST
jgi:hypothetical protein